jgi:DNA-binding MarR family transcriptional regulator
MLTELFGNYPQVRVLDFLVESRSFDYSLTDIARMSEVARPTLYAMIEDLVELDVIKETRRAGNARMFALNKGSAVVRSLTKFDLALSKKLVRKELREQDAGGDEAPGEGVVVQKT